MALMADTAAAASGPALAAAARDAIRAVDELVWTVNTRNDTVEGFISYAVAYGVEYLQAAGVALRVRTPSEISPLELDADVRRHIFLAFKEALNNVVKHSGAADVILSFEMRGAELAVTIVDNGRGFDTSIADPNGNGLSGMRDRMQSIRGRCEVVSQPGVGTEVHIHVLVVVPVL
jgi:signal transduction histidine kinase